jgi:hypothetical protein
MFYHGESFNQPLPWDVGNGLHFVSGVVFAGLFHRSLSFSWQGGMFDRAWSFNQALASWDVSKGQYFVSGVVFECAVHCLFKQCNSHLPFCLIE